MEPVRSTRPSPHVNTFEFMGGVTEVAVLAPLDGRA
jgi:hypothetical protein